MSLGWIWHDGQFTWTFVCSVVYLVLVLLASDYLWRITRLGGRMLALLTGTSAVAGIVAIYWIGN